MLYGNYQFKCRLETGAVMPPYKGSTFRGVFGHALKRVVCALKRQTCEECLLKKRCVYALVFETPLAMEIPAGSKMSHPPHPFVIEPPRSEETELEAGQDFDCRLLLFGDVNKSFPYFVYAFDQMGKIGIGRRVNGSRGKFGLKEVRSKDTRLYSEEDQVLNQTDAAEFLSLSAKSPLNGVTRVPLVLETPLRIKFKNRYKAELPFHVLTRTMLRRVSSLFNVYGEGEPKIDYRGLVERAKDIKVVENNLNWLDWRRYSNRQERAMFMGGITGSITYEGDLDAYLPLMEFCEKVNIGKGTAFGLGKFKIQLVL